MSDGPAASHPRLGWGLGLAVGVAVFLLAHERGGSDSTAVVDILADQDRLLARRAASDAPGESLGLLEDSVLAREVIDEDDARMLYPGLNANTVWDRHTVFGHAPGVRLRVAWPEHPRGEWVMATDARGFREDDARALDAPDLRVLVLGDSHTDGVCMNAESFPNLLEQRIAAARPGATVDVINAGKGGWCAYNYLGAVERWRDLRPDVVLVALYGGNDLVEAPLYRHVFERTQRPPEQREMALRVAGVAARHAAACSQALSQAAYLAWTDDLDGTVETTARVLDELARTCEVLGSRLALAYLPAPTQVEPERHAERIEPARTKLGLEPGDLARLDRARDALLARAAELGIETLDLTPALREGARSQRMYWERDLHLGLAGHATVAAALFEALEAAGWLPGETR